MTVIKKFRCVDWTGAGCRRIVYAMALCGTLLGAGGLRGSAQARMSCADLTKLDIPEATVTMVEVVQPLEFKLPSRTDNPGGPGDNRREAQAVQPRRKSGANSSALRVSSRGEIQRNKGTGNFNEASSFACVMKSSE
jgi:hypothetical protein